MTDQVTSIEQSKRLIELGVPADKASMVWEWGWVCGTVDEENYELKIWQECKLDKILAYQEFPESFIPAFTVADLLGVMPPDIPAVVGQNHDYALTLSNNFCWNLRYENSHTHQCIGEQLEFDLVDLLCNRIEWIVSNGYELNL